MLNVRVAENLLMYISFFIYIYKLLLVTYVNVSVAFSFLHRHNMYVPHHVISSPLLPIAAVAKDRDGQSCLAGTGKQTDQHIKV